MSMISDMRADIIAKLTAALGSLATIGRWAGEETALTDVHPSVYVQWMGGTAGENEEIGAITYLHENVFSVFVAAEDDGTLGYGDDQAAHILELSRAALQDQIIATVAWAKPMTGFDRGMTESLVKVHSGIYVYEQQWAVQMLVY